MLRYNKMDKKDGVMPSGEVPMKPMIVWFAAVLGFVLFAAVLVVMVSGFMGASAAEVATAVSIVGIPSAVGMALLGTIVAALLFYCHRLIGRRW